MKVELELEKKEIKLLKDARRRRIENSIAISGMDNDAPVSEGFLEIAERYINLEISLIEFNNEVLKMHGIK